MVVDTMHGKQPAICVSKLLVTFISLLLGCIVLKEFKIVLIGIFFSLVSLFVYVCVCRSILAKCLLIL